MKYIFNYEALERQPTADELRAYTPPIMPYRNWNGNYVSTLFSIVVMIFIIGVVLASYRILNATGGYVLMALTIFGSVGVLMMINRRVKRRLTKLHTFAHENNLTFLPRAELNEHGMLFSIGTNRVYREIIAGQDFTVGSYEYTIGSGKNRQTSKWGYASIALGRNLPNMVLDAKGNDTKFFGLTISDLPVSFKKDQKLSLEGDFDKYFTLYAPKEYERDALYVFAPDLMALLIDESAQYDAEIVDNRLYFYSPEPFDLTKKELVERLVSIINLVGTKTFDATDNYADERVANRMDDIVAPAGQRLKKGVPTLMIIIVVLVVGFQLAMNFLPLLGK